MGGGKGSQKVTIGYKYFATVHMVLCHGPVNNINRIIVGDKQVWEGSIKDGEVSLNLPSLFGGENSEGGIAGNLDIQSGMPNQAPNEFLTTASEKPLMPAFRGVVSVILKNFMLASMNPYPKPWRFRVARFPTVIPGLSGTISSYAANPAQIIAECLVNPEWGLGVNSAELDNASFVTAGQTLNTEKFGLCARWDEKESIEDFISLICQIIDAQLQMDPASGKYALKLIRQDYVQENLMVLGPSDIISLSEFSRPDPRELINQVTIIFEDYKTGVEQSITENNTAALALNPAINAMEMRYQAVPTQELARRIALRELAQYSSGMARCNLEVNRKAATLKMGDCFVLNWPPLGIEAMVMRITHVAQGSSDDWRVKLECIQDINGIPETSFEEPTPGWTPPSHTPVAITTFRLYELPFFLVNQLVLTDSESRLNDLPAGFGFLGIAASQPGGTTMGFKVNSVDAYGQWAVDTTISFISYGRLAVNITPTQTSIGYVAGYIDDIDLNTPILIDNEWMLLTGMTSSTLTVARGAMDTVPQAHDAPALIWFVEYNEIVNPKIYVTGQTAQVKLQPYAANGDLALASCPTQSLVMTNRASRPIVPGNPRVNNIYRPTTLATWATTLTWGRRDRLDTARIRTDTDPDYVPEVGTLYTIAIREKIFPSSAWTAASTTTDLDTNTLALTDKYSSEAFSLEITLSAKLGTLTCIQNNVVTFEHSPWIPTILSMTQTTPSGAVGDKYVIPSGATGVWAGKTNQIARRTSSSYLYYTPAAGQKINMSGVTYEFNGSTWEAT